MRLPIFFRIKMNSLFVKVSVVSILSMAIPLLVTLFYSVSSTSRSLESEASSMMLRAAIEKRTQVEDNKLVEKQKSSPIGRSRNTSEYFLKLTGIFRFPFFI